MVDYIGDPITPRRFLVKAKLAGTSGSELIRSFVSSYLEERDSAEASILTEAPDPHAETLRKAREMLEKGGRAAASMEDAILGAYAIHHRRRE